MASVPVVSFNFALRTGMPQKGSAAMTSQSATRTAVPFGSIIPPSIVYAQGYGPAPEVPHWPKTPDAADALFQKLHNDGYTDVLADPYVSSLNRQDPCNPPNLGVLFKQNQLRWLVDLTGYSAHEGNPAFQNAIDAAKFALASTASISGFHLHTEITTVLMAQTVDQCAGVLREFIICPLGTDFRFSTWHHPPASASCVAACANLDVLGYWLDTEHEPNRVQNNCKDLMALLNGITTSNPTNYGGQPALSAGFWLRKGSIHPGNIGADLNEAIAFGISRVIWWMSGGIDNDAAATAWNIQTRSIWSVLMGTCLQVGPPVESIETSQYVFFKFSGRLSHRYRAEKGC